MVQPTQADIEARLAEPRQLVADKWGWFLALGIVLVIVGLAAIVFPLFAGAFSAIFVGWLFLIGGVVTIVHAFSAQRWSGFLWSLLVGVLYLIAGGYMVLFPLTGLITPFVASGDGAHTFRIAQGVEMGRPSTLLSAADYADGVVGNIRIGGRCVAMMRGELLL